MYVPTFWLCLLTDFRAKYTYGLLMTQGVSEKYKIADFQEIFFWEKTLSIKTSVCPNFYLSKPLFVQTSVCPNLCPNFDAPKEGNRF